MVSHESHPEFATNKSLTFEVSTPAENVRMSTPTFRPKKRGHRGQKKNNVQETTISPILSLSGCSTLNFGCSTLNLLHFFLVI